MNDCKFLQGTDGVFDLVLEDGDIANEDGFDTAIFVSILTDARAPSDRIVSPENRRGWIGNIVSPVEGRDLGGLLWLTEQSRLNQETLNEVVDFTRKSLTWFTDDSIASEVLVSGNIVPLSGIRLTIPITALDGTIETRYINLWEVTGNAI